MVRSRHAADQKRAVWEGKLAKTDTGHTKADLAVSKSGTIVDKKKQQAGIKQMKLLKASGLAAPPFTKATAKKPATKKPAAKKPAPKKK